MSYRSYKFVYFVLVILTVFFMINRLMLQNIIVLSIMFLYTAGKGNRLITEKIVITIVLIAMFTLFQLVIGITSGLSGLFSSAEAIKEIERAVIFILVLLIVSPMIIEASSYVRLWRVILTIVVGICILQYIKVFDIDSYLIYFYGFSRQFYNSARTSFNLFRGGSVFVNPNVLSSFLIGFLGNYLVVKDRIKENKILRFYTYAIIGIGLLLAGSRTGILVAIIEIMVYSYYVAKRSGKKTIERLLIIAVVIIGFVSLITSQGSETIGKNYRAFDVQSGFSSSLSTKLHNFEYVMARASAINYLFGFGPFDYGANDRLLIDFEVGYFIAFYGLIGLLFFVLLLRAVMHYGEHKKNYHFQRLRNLMFVISMLLYGFTAGIYFNLRMFPIYIAIFFPMLRFAEDSKYEEVYSV